MVFCDMCTLWADSFLCGLFDKSVSRESTSETLSQVDPIAEKSKILQKVNILPFSSVALALPACRCHLDRAANAAHRCRVHAAQDKEDDHSPR